MTRYAIVGMALFWLGALLGAFANEQLYPGRALVAPAVVTVLLGGYIVLEGLIRIWN